MRAVGYLWIGLLIFSSFMGCGGGSSGSSSINTAVFVDSPVDGLAYERSEGEKGVTKNGGQFLFSDGEVVTFRLGNVTLGSVRMNGSKNIVTPMDLVTNAAGKDVDLDDPRVIAIARFLLSADEDDDADNGIQITDSLRKKLMEKPAIELDKNEISDAVIAAYLDRPVDKIVSKDRAKQHLLEVQNRISDGKYDQSDGESGYPETGQGGSSGTAGNGGGTGNGGVGAVSGDYTLLAWNDLGMHCMDGNDYSVFSILPPYNNLTAQLIAKGDKPEMVERGVTLTYEAIPSLNGKLNTQSATKTNFWDYAKLLYGKALSPNVGLAGKRYDQNPKGQTLDYDTDHHWWKAEGIPVTPYNDDGSFNSYPMVKVTARDTAGKIVAQTTTVLPVSDEMDCRKCHGSDSNVLEAKPAAGWVRLNDPEKDYKYNILRLHDEKEPSAVADHLKSLKSKGWDYNSAGLEATAKSGTPILCAACHRSNALPGSGVDLIKPLTRVIHSHHADVTDPYSGMALDNALNRNACYACHPGATTQCLRGAMGGAKGGNGQNIIQCQNCHGSMRAVGAANREGWLDEPNCQACHQEGKRYRDGIVDQKTGTLRQAIDRRFATTPDTPLPGKTLYRFSSGHGGMKCEACHGSTHAVYPSVKPEDNVQSMALQGHSGTIGSCTVCHTVMPNTSEGGPHGMHSVGQVWVDAHKHYAERNLQKCAACHGADYRGSPLSATMQPRTFVLEHRTKTFAMKHQVSCYDCHDGPNGDD
ncbi:hypothetical protein [Hydrogenimonas sp. SS33]|uniref:hypothetical protein n=1 Tax=Hydrogenimonas leucolamina TaxID=2954236 RepID=UPI00336BE75E